MLTPFWTRTCRAYTVVEHSGGKRIHVLPDEPVLGGHKRERIVRWQEAERESTPFHSPRYPLCTASTRNENYTATTIFEKVLIHALGFRDSNIVFTYE